MNGEVPETLSLKDLQLNLKDEERKAGGSSWNLDSYLSSLSLSTLCSSDILDAIEDSGAMSSIAGLRAIKDLLHSRSQAF